MKVEREVKVKAFPPVARANFLCFFCAMKIVLAEGAAYPSCPNCGNKLS